MVPKVVTFILLLSVIVGSCNKQVEYIGSTSPSENPYLAQLDTFQANAVIYRPDSFKTSGRNFVYAGKHDDPVFGLITCTPYVRFSLPSTIPEPDNTSYFDSMVLIMKPNATSFGDTNTLFGLGVYSLTENMAHANGDLFYNNHSFSTALQSLGNRAIVLRPAAGDSVAIKVDNNFGNELFDLFKAKSTIIKDSALFRTYFKGIALKVNQGNVIYSFPLTDSAFKIRIYYHQDLGKPVSKHFDFTVLKNDYAFTNISVSRLGTPLQQLDTENEMNAGDLIVFNELTQVRTRLYFPGFNDIKKMGSYVKIFNASLELKPVASRYKSGYKLPQVLNLFKYSIAGALSGPMAVPGANAEQSGSLYIDDSYGRETKYTFDITEFLETELTATVYTTQKLVPAFSSEGNDLSTLVAGNTANTLNRSRLVLAILVQNDE